MPQFHVTRTDQMTQAVNTFSAVETNADGSTGGAITVPQQTRKVAMIRGVVSLSAETATDSGGVVTLRLAGNGLRDGQQELVVGGFSCIAQGTPATGIVNNDRVVELEVDVATIPGNQINLSAAYSGVDFGTPEIGITLVFE